MSKTPLLRIRRPKYRIWSVRTIVVVAIFVIAGTAAAVFAIGTSSVIVEAERLTAIVAGLLFLFLACGLFLGVRVRKTEIAPSTFEPIRVDTTDLGVDVASNLDLSSAFESPAGCIVGLLAALVIGLLIVFLLPLVINLFAVVIFLLVLVLFWIFRMALRQVFARSWQCHRRLLPSLKYAAIYTFLYSGWLLGLLLVARYFVERRGGS